MKDRMKKHLHRKHLEPTQGEGGLPGELNYTNKKAEEPQAGMDDKRSSEGSEEEEETVEEGESWN
jgi:hypothetical protein